MMMMVMMQKLILSCLVVAMQCRHRIQDKYNSVRLSESKYLHNDSMSESSGHLIRDGEYGNEARPKYDRKLGKSKYRYGFSG